LPSEKILMGVPYYTRGWENVQPGPSGTGLNGTSNTPATGKYNTLGDLDENGNQIPAGVNNLWHAMNLMEQDSNLKVHWDNVGKVPYLWNNNEKVFLTFENEQSIDERLKYIEENNLGGALIWTMDGDYDLNPNYVEGSTELNEGKYTFGDTLTKRFSNGLKTMGPNEKTPEDNEGIAPIAVDVELTGNYDHPNYTYDFKVTNYTEEEIKGGWELSFDLPKSAQFKSAWGGQVTEKDNGDFTTITIQSPGWQNLAPGASTNLQGMIGLCFSGVRNVRFNGLNPLGQDAPQGNQAPVLSGVANQTINVGEAFDALAGITATDKEDGDLTAHIEVIGEVDITTPGEYTLTYSVTDGEGLTTTQTITVTVKEVVPEPNEAPVIYGAKDQTINVGEAFDALAGITAADKEDGDLTAQIEVTGSVDTTTPGEYSLTYSVTDSEGLMTTQTITITVKEDSVEPEPNQAPVIYGAEDKTIKVGEDFDALAGVTATDQEDGDLTAQLEVSGEVDTTQAGKYTLTYSVTDSENETTVKVRTITVQEVSVEGDTYDPTMIYYGGEIVIYKGQEYKAKWWTQGGTPDASDAWEKVVKPNEDGSIEWYEGLVCVGGEHIVYNGNVYKAKWWTTSRPGSDESWELIQ
ncbi:MAG: immunoglobulin-like domain-containing protein, partial [Cellulosilyticaceae bacterium]